MIAEAYANYKETDVEWLGTIPEHWELLPTKRFFGLVAEPAPDNNDYELLSIYTDIGVRPRKELEERGNRASTTDGYWMVRKGDLIVNKLLAWMGAIGMSEYDGVTSPAYDILRERKPLDPKFYHYLFRCGICFTEFRKYSRGIMDMRLRLYFDQFGQLPMPFPPLDEQKAISSFLDVETSKIDSLVSEQRRLIELLKEKRQAVISHAVTKGLDRDAPMKPSGIQWLGDVPEHWEVLSLKYLAILKSGDGITANSIEETGDYPVYGGNGLRGYTSDFTHDGHYVIIGRQGALCGNVNYGNGKFWASEHAVVASPTRELNTVWLGEMIRSMNLNQYSVSAAQPGLSMEFVGNLRTILPPVEEQREIAEFLLQKTHEFDALGAEAERAIELLQERRTALISAAVTGKIDVRKFASKEAVA